MVKMTGVFLIMAFAMSVTIPVHASGHPTVNVEGYISYQPRNFQQYGAMQTGNELQVDLIHRDHLGIDHDLYTTWADGSGNYKFDNIENWFYADQSRLNVIIRVRTSNPKTSVTNRLFDPYVFDTPTPVSLLTDYYTYWITPAITASSSSYAAIWIFEDIRNAWHFVNNNYASYDPGNVNAIWEPGLDCFPFDLNKLTDLIKLPDCNSAFTYGGTVPPHFIWISNYQNGISMDTVIHETGHMYMVNSPNKGWYTGCLTHSIFTANNVNCAWFEGWADFFPLAVNNDPCYNVLKVIACTGIKDQDYYNLEVHSRTDTDPNFNKGPAVEGRVAGALYDLYDNTNEGYDRISAGFYPIAHIALGNSPINTFWDFWNNWNSSSGQNQLLSGLTLWWNTINFIYWTYLPTVLKNP